MKSHRSKSKILSEIEVSTIPRAIEVSTIPRAIEVSTIPRAIEVPKVLNVHIEGHRPLLLIGFLLFFTSSLFAQVDTAWVRRYNGPAGYIDNGRSIAVDYKGYVYVVGTSYSVYGEPYYDYVTIKYTPEGDTVWQRRYDGPANSYDEPFSIAVDGSGNVYVTGQSVGLDPSWDFATVKYSANGDELWVSRYIGILINGTDWDPTLAIDNQGNVYVAGSSQAPFSTKMDYATVKYNANGDVVWVRRYNGPGNGQDWPSSVAVDNQGNVYVTGSSQSYGISYHDYLTIKYTSDGDTAWVRRFNGTADQNDWACGVAVDDSGNVYVTGTSNTSGTYLDYTTIKYTPDGEIVWVSRYNGYGSYSDAASAIAVDGSGNVYVTGHSCGPETDLDYATVKYNTNGVEQWALRYNGPGNCEDEPYSIAVDNQGNAYVTGHSYAIGTGTDYATIKYSSNGVEEWVERYNHTYISEDWAHSVAVDNHGNVYVTGGSVGDIATIKYTPEVTGNHWEKPGGVEMTYLVIKPNPTKGSVFVYYTVPKNDTATLKIYNIFGAVVRTKKSNKGFFTVENLPAGIYFLQLEANGHKYGETSKLIVVQ